MSDDDDWMSMLSPETRAVVERTNHRRHRVNLERVQRIHQGIDSEPMEFSASTIAKMLQDIADECDDHGAFTLHAVVRALLGTDDHHILVLKQKKPGKWVSPTVHESHANQIMGWLYTLANWELAGMKTEAAVAQIAELANVKRATVFAGIKEAEQFLASCRTLAPDADHLQNPRPSKERKT